MRVAAVSLGLGAVLLLGHAVAQDVGVSTQAQAPLPAISAPPSEVVGGQVGSQARYAREDHTHPRISRTMTVTTVAGGTFSGTWNTPLPGAPAVILTPIAANASTDCQLTAAPTTTGFQGRCWTAQTLAINAAGVAAGLNLNPVANTAAGVQVQVIALPQTQ